VLRKQVILEYLRTTSTRAKDISAKQIEAVIGLVLGPDGKSINISGKLQAKKEAGFLKILPSGTARSKKVYIDIPISVTEIGEKKDFSAGDFDISIRTFDDYEMLEKPENPCTKWFDYDKINSNLHMRNRAEGDFLRIDDLGHTQKLRRYLINKKVPSEERDGLLLLASDSEIYWIVGHRVCKAFEVSDDTKRVIEISVRRRRNE
jgi:tRNA(Ile)-lysidine synthase